MRGRPRRQVAFQHDLAAEFRRRCPRPRRSAPASPRRRRAAGRRRGACRRAASTASAVRTSRAPRGRPPAASCGTGRKRLDAARPGPSPRMRAALHRLARRQLLARRERIGLEIDTRCCSGSAQGRLSSGRRRPIGLSPGTRNIAPSRKNHLPVCQRRAPSSITRRSGSTLPTVAARPWPNTRASRARSSGSRSLASSASTLAGRRCSCHR